MEVVQSQQVQLETVFFVQIWFSFRFGSVFFGQFSFRICHFLTSEMHWYILSDIINSYIFLFLYQKYFNSDWIQETWELLDFWTKIRPKLIYSDVFSSCIFWTYFVHKIQNRKKQFHIVTGWRLYIFFWRKYCVECGKWGVPH